MSTEDGRDLRRGEGRLSVGLLPPQVLAVASIVAFLLYLSWRTSDYEEHARRGAEAGASVLLVLAAGALALLAHHALVDGDGRIVVPLGWTKQEGGDGGASPWGVAGVVALLLVLASHKSSFRMFGGSPWH